MFYTTAEQSNVCNVSVDLQRFETVEEVIKHFHLNPIEMVPFDSKKANDIVKVRLKYHQS